MRRFFLYIIMTLSLSISCTPEQPAVYMLRPHEELPEEVVEDKSFTKIFLAGTIDMGNSRDWQAEIYDKFSKMNGRLEKPCVRDPRSPSAVDPRKQV